MSQAQATLTEGQVTKQQAEHYLRQMCLIRYFEDKIMELLSRNIAEGGSHLYAGEEAVAVGAMAALRPDDIITSTHRGHGHCIAKDGDVNELMAEILGKVTGCCRGKGGSLHLADVTKGNLGANGVVGGGIGMATGAALAQQMQKTGKIVVCFFGDGAMNEGIYHESANMASKWKLPLVYVVENNLYGMSVSVKRAHALCEQLHKRAEPYGFPAVVLDGQDPIAVRDAVSKAVEHARSGKGPYMVICNTYRYYGHSRSDKRAYRTKEEEQFWHDRDPIDLWKARMSKAGILSAPECEAIDTLANDAIEKATDFAIKSPLPEDKELFQDVFTPTPRPETLRMIEKIPVVLTEKDMPTDRKVAYGDALVEAQGWALEKDPKVFVMGEDVAIYGGAYGATKGLWEKYGDARVRDTAISEAAIVGAGIGAGICGMRPISEIMYVDFMTLVMDQLANQAAKIRYMFGGKTTVPLLIRTEGGAGRTLGAHHSQSLEAMFTMIPGVKVVMPATPFDAKGLLISALYDDNPVVFIEHKMLYKESGLCPKEIYRIPLGKADVKRPGKDITVLTYSRQLFYTLDAAKELAKDGISPEIIDLRSLFPLDMETILNSVKKTHKVLIVTEACKTGSFATEIAMKLMEEAWDQLDMPVLRLCGEDVPMPKAPNLEKLAIPNSATIAAKIREALR